MREKRKPPARADGSLESESAKTLPEYPAQETNGKSKPTSWRDVILIHPAAALFRMMSEAELRELAADLKKRGGIAEMPVLFKDADGKLWLLDGRNRLDAEELNGDSCLDEDGKIILRLFRIVTSKECDPYDFVRSANFHRRHLTDDQKRDFIAKWIERYPDKTARQIARETDSSPTTVGKVMSKVGHNTERTEGNGRKARGVKPGTKAALVKEVEGLEAHVQDLEAAREEPPRQTRLEKLTAENDALKKRVQELEYRLSQNGDLCDFTLSSAEEIARTMVPKMSRTKFQEINKHGLEYYRQKDAGQKPRKVAAKKPSKPSEAKPDAEEEARP